MQKRLYIDTNWKINKKPKGQHKMIMACRLPGHLLAACWYEVEPSDSQDFHTQGLADRQQWNVSRKTRTY